MIKLSLCILYHKGEWNPVVTVSVTMDDVKTAFSLLMVLYLGMLKF